MFNTVNHQEIQIKTSMRDRVTSVSMATTRETGEHVLVEGTEKDSVRNGSQCSHHGKHSALTNLIQ